MSLKKELLVCSELNENFIPTKEIDNGRFVRNPERPSRLRYVHEYLVENFESITPEHFSEEWILKVHDEKYYEYIKRKSAEVDGEYIPEVFFVDPIFDTGTPILRESFDAARKAVNVVLTSVRYVLENRRPVYALTRPPGHHAMRNYGGGYCYFNNVATAARYLENSGLRIAILDVDFHHGNGTQDIFYDDPSVLYVSIHGDPRTFFPWYSGYESEIGEGKAEGTNLNIPLPGGSDKHAYLEALEVAIKKIDSYMPDFLLISLGTDTHAEDPVGRFSLLSQDFETIGNKIATELCEKIQRVCIVHEGGYKARANFSAVKNFVRGFLGQS
ncbi:MAG TPA: histone deacetylase family protein [Fervidobacterium sp.]|nr:histone deacetylase family protein [Fervidobacterium sp.]HRD19532.1 histone deacetylase family protein [Fervidobacterium sp.]